MERAYDLQPKAQFPQCMQFWYVVRVIWRLCHIMSHFAIFTLIWVVMGGAWIFFWCAIQILFVGMFELTHRGRKFVDFGVLISAIPQLVAFSDAPRLEYLPTHILIYLLLNVEI